MKVAILTLEGFNELDSFIASAILNRAPDSKALICCPSASVTSMNGVQVTAQAPLDFAEEADAVLVGSGMKTRDYAADGDFLARLRLDPVRQLIGAQCSGALILHRLGLTGAMVASDSMTTPVLREAGLEVSTAPMHVEGNVATAGGCLASHYLAAWMIARQAGWPVAAEIIHYVAPVGQKDAYTRRAAEVVEPLLLAGQAAD